MDGPDRQERREPPPGDSCRVAAAMFWFIGLGFWGLGLFAVIPLVDTCYKQINAHLPEPGQSVVDVILFAGRPWAAVPLGLAVIGWTYLFLKSRRMWIVRLSWIAGGILWLAGIAAIAAIFHGAVQ